MDSTIVLTRPHLPWIENALNSGSVADQSWLTTNSSLIHLIGGDGLSINLPAPLVLALSPLLRSIVSNLHLCGNVSISVPSAERGVLVHLAEVLQKGETSVLFGNKYSGKILSSIQAILDMLYCNFKMSQEIKVEREGFEEDIDQNQVLATPTFSSNAYPADSDSKVNRFNPGYSQSKSEGSLILGPDEENIKVEVEIENESEVLYVGASLEDIISSPNQSHDYVDPQKNHNRVNDDVDKELSCPFCPRVVKSQKSMKQHILLSHPEPTHDCGKCDASFLRKNSLEKHIKSAHCKFQCKLCHLAYKSKIKLYSHLKTVHGMKTAFIRHKAKSLSYMPEQDMEWEQEQEHNDVRFLCNLCSKIFRSKESYMKHCDLFNHDPKLITWFRMPPHTKNV